MPKSEMTPRKAQRAEENLAGVMVMIGIIGVPLLFILARSSIIGTTTTIIALILLVAALIAIHEMGKQYIKTQAKQAEYDLMKETAEHTKQTAEHTKPKEQEKPADATTLSVSEAQRRAFHEAFDTAINNGHDGHAAARAAANIAFGPEAPHTGGEASGR